MKSHIQVTRIGRLRRYHRMARQALSEFGFRGAKLTFLTYEGNVMYRVDAPRKRASSRSDNLYHLDRYILRIHMDYHSKAAIESELTWLSALRQDRDLPVPEAISAPDGARVIELPIPGGGGAERKCSLLRWVDGRFVKQGLKAKHVKEWGRLMARLHEHASKWKPPKGFTRPRREWNGLFSDKAGFDHSADELWTAIPKKYRGAFESVVKRSKDVMTDLGRGKEAFGLVHADLMIHTNILFKGGRARVIDFDDCCFAYWLHDFAFALSSWQGHPREEWVRDMLIDGYSGVRTFPESQLKHLDQFLAVFNANLMLWMIDWSLSSPSSPESRKIINRYGRKLLRFACKA